MTEPRDYGKWLDKKLNISRNYPVPGVDIDFDVAVYDNELFRLGIQVEGRLIGDTFEECNP